MSYTVQEPFPQKKKWWKLNYHDQKIHRTPMHDIREHWTAVSTLLGLISSMYRNLHHWRSNQGPKIAVPKLYNWATSSYHTQVTPNKLVMVIARPNNLNVSCKLHPYSFQRTRSPPGPRLPKKLRNTHPRNYYTSVPWKEYGCKSVRIRNDRVLRIIIIIIDIIDIIAIQ